LAKELIKQINQPFFIHQHELAVTSSIGIVLYPEDGKDPEALLRNADTAMYHAKSDGANRYLFFNDSMIIIIVIKMIITETIWINRKSPNVIICGARIERQTIPIFSLQVFSKSVYIYFFAVYIIKIHHNKIWIQSFIVSYKIQTKIARQSYIMSPKIAHAVCVYI
jgi:hypothetical protein